MNICILSSTYHPTIGGAETYIRTLASNLLKRGHNVFVITDKRNNKSHNFEFIDGVKIYRCDGYLKAIEDESKVRWEQMYFSLLNDIHEILQQENVDIVHANGFDTSLLGSMIKSSINSKLVVTYHEQSPEKEPLGEGRCKFIFSNPTVDTFITGSQFYYNKAKKYGGENVELIYHGVHLPDLSNNSIPLKNKNFIILCPARLKERKGIKEFILAINSLRNEIPNIKGVIAGSRNSASNEYAEKLYEMINNLSLNEIVTIDEQIPFDKMSKVYLTADLVVQPSYAEGLGLSVLEAMAHEKAVIASSVDGINEIMNHKINGLAIQPKKYQEIADAIRYLYENRKTMQELAITGRKTVESKFDIERMVKETESVYKLALQN